MALDDELIGAIEHREFKKYDYCKTSIQLKSSKGKLYIDVRKWFKPVNGERWYAGRQGITLELDDWKQVIPLVQELVDANCK